MPSSRTIDSEGSVTSRPMIVMKPSLTSSWHSLRVPNPCCCSSLSTDSVLPRLALAVKYLHPSPPGDRFMRTPPALKRSAPGETNPAALLVLQRPVRSISTVSPSVPHRLAISTATLLPRFCRECSRWDRFVALVAHCLKKRQAPFAHGVHG